MSEELKDNRIIFAGHGGKGGNIRLPKEVAEGVNSLTGASGSLDLSTTHAEVLDVISEGEIQGLVTGIYNYSGVLGNVGWGRYTFTPNNVALGTSGVRWLQSVYWDDTPVVGSNGQFNFQQVSVNYAKGSPNGSNISDQILDELSITRLISERLRGGGDEFAKIYRILNKDCIATDVNIRITQLLLTSSKEKTLGDIQASSINYVIYYKPIFNNKPGGSFILGKAETVTGKVTAGYIRTSRINFNRDYSTEPGFLGWEIKIVRSTEDSTTSSLRNQSFVDSLTEIYGNKYTYPNSALVSQNFDAEFFAQIPSRKFLVNLIKVKVPSNYDPILKTYDESSPWDLTFKTDNQGRILKEWTDNPAWCYYDLLTNKRYGLGLYLDENVIDKASLYEIAQYCDTLVSDGYGGLEPRFTCNLYITSQDEAYKVINSMASIFRAINYYSAGSIYTSQDSNKQAIYQFTNANVIDGDFTYSSSAKKARHTISIVRYNDKTNFYKPAIEYVENVEGVRKYGIREVEVPAFGCTSRGQAIRLGRWALLTESLETESITFKAGIEASFLRPGDIFQIFDSHKKNQRLGGRLNSIVASPSSTNIVLDSPVTGLDSTTNYKFSLLTPSFYYDSSLVTGLDTSNISDIRKSQLQYFNFNTTNISYSGTKTIINVNTPLNYTDYNVSGNFVWMIEATGNNILGSISDDEWQTFRVINTKEEESHVYSIEGLQYDISKFAQIESGFSFSDDTAGNIYSIPPGPTGLQLYLENLTTNSQLIHFSFIPPQDISNVNNFRVFLKNSAFIAGDENNFNYLNQELPNSINTGVYFPTENNTYFFRVYSVSPNDVLSTGYAENSIVVSNVNPLKDIVISSLQLITGDFLFDNAGHKTSEIYSTDSPNFGWQAGIEGNINIFPEFTYRITARAPSLSNTPSNHIFYEITGYQNPQSAFEFDFNDNLIAVSNLGIRGPFREYDLVVEATSSGGFSSAGGNYLTSQSQDSDYSNPKGYDIVYVNNPKPSAIQLYTGDSSTPFYQTGNATQQWITQDGEIKIYFSKSGQTVALDEFFGDDIIGGTLYYSTLPFTQAEAKQQIPVSPPDKEINNVTVTSQDNPLSVALGLFNVNQQYIALALFDSFDIAINNNITGYLITGLNLSNVVFINTNNNSVGTYKAWVEIELNINFDNSSRLTRTLSSSWISRSSNVTNVQDKLVNENGNNYKRGVITFETPMTSNNYAIVTTTNFISTPEASFGAFYSERMPQITYYDVNEIHISELNRDYGVGAFNSVNPNNVIRKIFVGVMSVN